MRSTPSWHRPIAWAVSALALGTGHACHQRRSRATAPALAIGVVVAFTGEHAPAGWLLCDGRPLLRRDWPELYAVLGTSHGAGVSEFGVHEGDFNLPDYRGRFLRGLDLSAAGRRLGADPDAPSRAAARAATGNAGNRVGSYQADGTALPRDPAHPFRTAAPDAHPANLPVHPAAGTATLVLRPGTGAGRLVVGGDGETRPKNVAVRWIIRARP